MITYGGNGAADQIRNITLTSSNSIFFPHIWTPESQRGFGSRAQSAVVGTVVGVSQVLNLELVCPEELEVRKSRAAPLA